EATLKEALGESERLTAVAKKALDESEYRRAENHLDRGLAEAEHGHVGLGMLWMARGLEPISAGADDLAWTIRVNLAGWRRQLFALTDCQTPAGKVLAFGADGDSAWTVDQDKRVARRWELTRGQFAGPSLEHPMPVTVLAVSPDGRLVGT